MLKAHLKNLTRHSIVYTLSTFIQRTLGLVMMPIYTSKAYLATQSDYGDLTLFYTFVAFMNIIYLYGMDSAFLRYYFLGKHSRNDTYKTAFIGVTLNALLISAIIFVSSTFLSQVIFNSVDYVYHVKLSATILFLDVFCNLPYLILRAEEKSVQFSVIKVIRFIIELFLNILFVVYYKMGFIGILYANVLAAFMNVLILLPYQFPYLRGKWNTNAFKSMVLFAIPMIPNGIAYLIVEVSDKFLMLKLLDKETLGLYSANYKFGTILLFLVIAFRTAWQPFFLKLAEQKEARDVYSRVLTYFTLMGVVVVVFVSYLIEYIVKIPLPGSITLLGKQYWSGVTIIPLILTSYLFYGIYVNLTVGIYIRKKAQLMIIFTGLAAIVNVSSNFYLMPHYGIMGAAIATLLSYLIMVLTIFVANQKIYPVQYDYTRLAFLFIILVLMLFVYYYYQPQLLTRLVLLALLPVVLWISGFFRKAETAVIKKLFAR